MEQIKPGDVVCGRPMTVERITGEIAVCVWFDSVNQLHRGEFAISELFHTAGTSPCGDVSANT